jgi:hypothetical protein
MYGEFRPVLLMVGMKLAVVTIWGSFGYVPMLQAMHSIPPAVRLYTE